MKREPERWRDSQQMPDPLRGAWFMTAFFTVYIWLDDRFRRWR